MKAFFSKICYRHYLVLFGLLLTGFGMVITDPSSGIVSLPYGAAAISKLASLPAMVFAVIAIWMGSKALFDYINLGELVKTASQDPIGAAIVFCGVMVGRVALSLLAMGMLSIFAT